MNRAVWIARILGLGLFLVLIFLMLDLYAKLRRMPPQSRPPAVNSR